MHNLCFFGHSSKQCKYKNYKCNLYKQRGHLKKMCTSKNVNIFEDDTMNLFSMLSETNGPIKVKLKINNSIF